MKPSEIVTHAARTVNIIAHNEELSESELADGMSHLNRILSNMSMQPLMAKNGIAFPLSVNDVQTGMDDQLEFALIDVLAVRLAGVYQLPIAPQIQQDAMLSKRNLENWNIKPLYEKPDSVLLGLSNRCEDWRQ